MAQGCGTSLPQSIHFPQTGGQGDARLGIHSSTNPAAAANDAVAALTQQEAATGKKEEEHKTAAALPADLRDAVFGIPLLVQTIAEF